MVKKADDIQISKRRDGRFQVRKRGGGFINGDEKAKILHEKGHIKLTPPKPKEEEPAAEAPGEGGAEEAPAEG